MRQSLAHSGPDRVPVFELMINQPPAEKIMGRDMLVGIGGRVSCELLYNYVRADAVDEMIDRAYDDHVSLYRELDLDAVVPPGVVLGLMFDVPEVKKVGPNRYRMQKDSEVWWEVSWDPDSDSWGEADHYLLHQGIEGMQEMVGRMEEAGTFGYTAEQVEFVKNKYAPIKDRYLLGTADVCMPNHTAWFSVFLEAMVLAPELVERYIAATNRMMKTFVDFFHDAGFDGIIGGTDFAGTSGPFFSPAMFERFYAGPLAELVSHCASYGMPFIKHTDGNVNTMIDRLLIETGASGFHAIEPAAGMDIVALKKNIGDRVSLWGNVDCGRLLTSGSEEEVRAETRRLIEKCSPGGGYLLSSSNSIHSGVNADLFLAMLDEARK